MTDVTNYLIKWRRTNFHKQQTVSQLACSYGTQMFNIVIKYRRNLTLYLVHSTSSTHAHFPKTHVNNIPSTLPLFFPLCINPLLLMQGICSVKIKVKLWLCLTKHHAMKTYGEMKL